MTDPGAPHFEDDVVVEWTDSDQWKNLEYHSGSCDACFRPHSQVLVSAVDGRRRWSCPGHISVVAEALRRRVSAYRLQMSGWKPDA